MSAIIAHYLFGEEIISLIPNKVGSSKDEIDAFLLGNQGPDVFFFAYMNPLLNPVWGVGTRLHKEPFERVLTSLESACKIMPVDLQPICRSYIAGLVCHYALDSTVHPFVYAQQFEICDAGIEGLDRSAGSEVHAEIEKELDMLTLSKLRNRTIGGLPPSFSALSGSDFVLQAISLLYASALNDLFGITMPSDAFGGAVRAYRIATSALYSPKGIKSMMLGGIEKLFRKYSMVEAMSHRDRMLEQSDFDNEEHCDWIDPYTGDIRSESYWDLFEASKVKAISIINALPGIDPSELAELSGQVDFNGKPTAAKIISVSDE